MSITNRGSIYDKIINEDWFSTPDMGEYYNNYIYKLKADQQSEKEGNTEFFVENPPTENPGYHEDLSVVVVKAYPQSIYSKFMDSNARAYNRYDGDTIQLSLNEIQQTTTPFKLYYSDTKFENVHHYLKESMQLGNHGDDFSLRFIGLNAPEITHYSDYVTSNIDDDIDKIKYEQFMNNNTFIQTKWGQVPKSSVTIDPYKIVNGEVKERSANDEITLVRFVMDKKDYPSLNVSKKIEYREAVGSPKTSIVQNKKVRKCVVTSHTDVDLDYHKASLQARDIVENAFKNATDCIILLDTVSINGKKSAIPESYRKSFEDSTKNPFYSLYDMWKSLKGEKAAYKYAGYRVPGQEANGRFLAAIYLKINNQWINLNKKVLYECDRATKAEYTSSADDMVNNYYLAKGFKLWTYDKNGQLFIDGLNDDVFNNKDDRKQIQQEIAGCDLDQMRDHTVMIGDTLFMVPPTSIRAITQTKTGKHHLLRAKGAMAKTLPKTERMIQMDLFFNGEEGINGIPYTQLLPNGQERTYKMNGLRALIAQYKLTPFLPIHNSYINDVLGIEAVSLVSYSVSTIPNFPRTLQVSITLQEFDWVQYMPCQAIPENSTSDDLYRNGFSETIYFPLLRFYYQRAIERGDDIKDTSFAGVGINDPDYVNATLGNKTALQPMDFKEPLIKFYTPNEDLLKARKQAVIEMKTKPLGTRFNFTERENEWIRKMNSVNTFIQEALKNSSSCITSMTNTTSEGYKPFLFTEGSSKRNYSYQELLAGNGPMIVHGISNRQLKTTRKDTIENHITPAHEEILKAFNKYRSDISNVISSFDINTSMDIKTSENEFRLEIVYKLNTRFFEESNSLNKIRKFCGKQLSLTSENLFKDDEIRITYKATFNSYDRYNEESGVIKKPLLQSNGDTLTALAYLASFTDSEKEGYEDFDINEEIEGLKDSIDIEDADSIKFDSYYIGEPIVTGITSSYNNVFANMSLKAVDGHAAQYTGGTDSSLDIEMIADDFTVGQLYHLNRLCMRYLINYRKVIKCSPLRIDSDITRMLGLHEVIIDALDVNTIPDYPGKYKVLLKLSSVDRTLRNKEALNKLQGIDNSSTEKDLLINTKNYFDLKMALGKAELYPDLELPTIEELEKSGYFFMQHRYQPERIYPDPDFYYLYWYPTLAHNLRTSITEFFENPENFDYSISGDLFQDTYDLSVKIKDNEGNSLFEVIDWDEKKDTYAEMNEKLKALALEKYKDYVLNDDSESNNDIVDSEGNVILSKKDLKELQEFSDLTSSKLEKLDVTNKILNKLQEQIDYSNYETHNINTYTNVTVKSIDVLDTESKKDKTETVKLSQKLKDFIKKELKKPITQDYNKTYEFVPHFVPDKYENYKGMKEGGVNIVGQGTPMSYSDTIARDIARLILNDNDLDFYEYSKYVSQMVKACGVGVMGTEGVFNSSSKEVHLTINNGTYQDSLCYPKSYEEVTNEKGKKVKRPICLYEDAKTSEMLIALNDEDVKQGVIFGRYGIKKFSGDSLARMFQSSVAYDKAGFLDPYYNKDIYTAMYGEEGANQKTFDKRESNYIQGIMNNINYAQEATFRQMLVWIYILIEQETFISTAQYHAAKLIQIGKNADKFWDNDKIEELSKSLFDSEEEIFEAPTAFETVCNAVKSWGHKDKMDQLLGEGTYDKVTDGIEEQEKRIKELLKTIQENAEDYAKTLIVGMFYTAGAIAMSGFESSILKAVEEGDMGTYANLISTGLAANSYANLSEEQKRVSRYAQYLNYYFDEDERYEKNPLTNVSYNNRVQRAYLKAANDPKQYILHSFYDMVMHDKRGSMARAFPTYYMLLIDEGRNIGLWKLQDNFYNMNSIIEFEVVKSRKIAADTAKIVMTNLYGTFNTDDTDQKDEYEYTIRDVWESIFSPRTYFQEEYLRRKNARDVNTTKMQPGARVHLRMGYSSNAAELPIVFNGCVTEFEAGETMTLICQGDGVELANPHMFNAMDGKDVQDIKHSDDFMVWKKLQETWDNLSTPRDMLVNPLAAEGTWIQELIRKYSNGRFFNSNPFGIVHFGDKKFNTIFTTNGEVEQNIYEALSKPTWNYKESGINTIEDGIEKEYKLSEAPRVKISLSQGFSYWDLMHIASSLSPDFICAIAPFQLRSTIFHGHPRFYYAYDYITIDGKIIEKRKPYQQYHIFTSFSDIIDNRMATSQKDVRTNAVGLYTGTGWLSKKPKTVGPLFVDIDIYPEYQKSTSVNLNFEYKNNDILPFNVPVVDKILDEFDWTDGPNSEMIAWRATANALKDSIKDMYKGELIVMGDPTVKPYNKFTIQDSYEDITGTAEVETVVHMFTTETGFTTHITPDCISAIDNKYEATTQATIGQCIAPAVVASGLLAWANIDFHKRNRPMYLSLIRASKKGMNVANNMATTALATVGKEQIQRDAMLINSEIPKSLKSFLMIEDVHINFSDAIYKVTSAAKRFKGSTVNGGKSLLSLVDDLEKLEDIFDSLDISNFNEIEKILNSSAYKETGALKEFIDNKEEILNGIKSAKKASVIEGNDLTKIINSLEKISNNNAEAQKVLDAIGDAKKIDLSKDKKVLNALKSLGKASDDFTTSGLDDLAKVLTAKSKGIAEGLSAVDKLSDISKVAGTTSKLATVKALLSSQIVSLVAQICLTKSAQNFLTNKLRNLQVLTIYPLKKDNLVWTAGINGHQGSVFGSATYDEPGWLENLAIKFFDYGSNSGSSGVAKFLGLLRDIFFTTDEMKEIVEGYKRGNGYSTDHQSEDKNRVEAQASILESLAKQQTLGYSDYKHIYFTDRLSMANIKNKDTEATKSYAYYKITNVDNIEHTTQIADKLVSIYDSSIVKLLDSKDAFIWTADFDKNGTPADFEKINMKRKNILTGNGSTTTPVYVKEIKAENNPLTVYDVPYLRPDSILVLDQVLSIILRDIEPEYDNPTCTFSNIGKHPFILHNGTRINSNAGWRSTGFLFTIEVKNYTNLSNIINKIEQQRDKLTKEYGTKTPFTIKREQGTEFGNNSFSVFVHCPII